ncbi:MAG: sigma 54-interacting transcriptional regulator [Firmicutes bacterium]|nr:sigma 54-interacting transcriptional regulator [Bacillota bacterium]
MGWVEDNLKSENLLEIMNHVPDGIAVVTNEGIYSYVNKGYERLIGIESKEIISKKVSYAVEKGYISSPSLTEIILHTKKSASIMQKAALTGRELLISGNPVFDQHKKLLFIVAVLRDMTDLNRIKQELEERTIEAEFYQAELARLQKEKAAKICYRSKVMADVIDLAARVAPFDATVLITGESGVGKEIIARFIHDLSSGREHPFVAVNCAAIPEQLIESELFGYEGGAFTGARKQGKVGLFEAAHGGTLFLDEIGDLSLKTQARLLRVLQDKNVRRVGSIDTVAVDTRVIAATNKDLEQLVEKGEFREDLYYRLKVVPIRIPPLRERKEDIAVLTHYFIQQFNKKYGFTKAIEPEVLQLFYDYDWPGNVRELEHTIERLLITSADKRISLDTLVQSTSADVESFPFASLEEYLQNTERRLLQDLYSSLQSTRKLAKLLNISQATVVRKLQRYGITEDSRQSESNKL